MAELKSLSAKIRDGELAGHFVTNFVPTKEVLIENGFDVVGMSGADVVTKTIKQKGKKDREVKVLQVTPVSKVEKKCYVFDKSQTDNIVAFIKKHIKEEPFSLDPALKKYKIREV